MKGGVCSNSFLTIKITTLFLVSFFMNLENKIHEVPTIGCWVFERFLGLYFAWFYFINKGTKLIYDLELGKRIVWLRTSQFLWLSISMM